MEMKCERGKEYPQNVQMPMDKKCKMKWKLKKYLKILVQFRLATKIISYWLVRGYFFGICFWNFFFNGYYKPYARQVPTKKLPPWR